MKRITKKTKSDRKIIQPASSKHISECRLPENVQEDFAHGLAHLCDMQGDYKLSNCKVDAFHGKVVLTLEIAGDTKHLQCPCCAAEKN